MGDPNRRKTLTDGIDIQSLQKQAPQKTTSDESTQIAGANAQIPGLGDLKVQDSLSGSSSPSLKASNSSNSGLTEEEIRHSLSSSQSVAHLLTRERVNSEGK